jgi:hypothetical protein
MKNYVYLALTLIVLTMLPGACGDKDEPAVIDERPDGIIAGPSREELIDEVKTGLPEKQNNATSHPELFSSTCQKLVVLTKASDVYVTFISEGAFFDNTFGWYAYDSTSVPSAGALKLNVLFPNVSDRILKEGDILRLGDKEFPAGTVIGFFLVIQGWDNGVHMDRQKFYANLPMNPNSQQQHVLFRQKGLGDMVLCFEDLSVADTSDFDFNDIVFSVSDNLGNREVENFDLRKVVELGDK